MHHFTYDQLAARIVFGAGRARTALAGEISRLGAERVLVIASTRDAERVATLVEPLGELVAGTFTAVREHVPLPTAEAARAAASEVRADAVLAIGGGSTVGAAKAVALTARLPVVAVPTTYAGSEVTPVWGLTENGRKTTGTDPAVLPRVVVYDPELTATLPRDLAAASGFNALAHAVEAMWAPRRNPVSTAVARGGDRAAGDRAPQGRPGRAAVRRVARRVGVRRGRLGPAPQALPRAGRDVRPAARPHPRRRPAARPGVQRPGRAGRGGSGGPGAGRRRRGRGAAGARRRARRPAGAARAGDARGRDREGRRAHRAGGAGGQPRPGRGRSAAAAGPRGVERGGPVTTTDTTTSGKREQAVTDEVVASFAGTKDDRLREVLESLTRHLHAFARDVRLTTEEWEAGIGFLTRVGHITDDRRQEFILLSDVLGLSMQVVGINAPADPRATESTVFGPFFVDDAPRGPARRRHRERRHGHTVLGHRHRHRRPTASRSPAPGSTSGRPTTTASTTCSATATRRPAAGGCGPGRTAATGSGPCGRRPTRSPTTGPVGDLLTATGRGPMRPAHLHFKVEAPGHRTLVTHIFVAGDPYLDSDAVFGVKDSLVVDVAEHPPGTAPDGRALDTPWTGVHFDIVLEKAS